MKNPQHVSVFDGYRSSKTVTVPHAVLLDSVPALIAYIDKDLRYQYVNAAFEKWMGVDADDIIGKEVNELLGNDTVDEIRLHIDLVLSGKEARFEHAVTNKKGPRYVDVCYTPDLSDDGKVNGFVIHVNDVTEKKESERKLRDYFENASIGLHWVNKDGIVVWANDAELAMLGYSRDEYIGHHISEFHADAEIIKDILTRLSRKESLHEYEAILKCKDGSTRNVSINSNVLFENGKFVHTRCFTIDITQRKQAELALKQSEARYRQLVNSLPVAFYTCDRDGRITYYNDVAVKLWGHAPALNTDVQKFCAFYKIYLNGTFIPTDKTPMATAVQTGQSFHDLEPVFERPDGSRFDACVNIEPMYDADNNLSGAINVFQDVTKLKATELALRESEAQYRQLVQLLPTAVYTCDADGRIRLFNQAAVNLWGRKPEAGKDMWCGSWKIFAPEDGSPVSLDTCPMAIALKEGRAVFGREIVVERPDGRRRNVAPYPQPILDSSGKVIGAVNMLIDITEQKRTSQALRESEQRFRMISDLVPIAIWMTDENGNCNYLNSQWTQLTGRSVEEGYGDKLLSYIHPDDKDKARQAWLHCLFDRKPYNMKFRFLSIGGNYAIVQANGYARFNDKGELLGYIGVLQDISLQEQNRAFLEKAVQQRTEEVTRRTEDLRKSEERYHRMIDEVEDYAIILLSREGKIENWNRGAEKIKGYRADEIIGKSFRQFYTEGDRKRRHPDKLLKKAIVQGRATDEGWRIRKDGTTFWASVVITALHDENDLVVGFSKVTRDLTQRKAAEDELKANSLKLQEKNLELERMNQELQKMNEELASFAYISSHDLQEPLRKIQTFSSRILELEDKNFGEKSKDYFNRIQISAHRMRSLIEDLLVYSRTNTSERKFALVDLNRLLYQVREELSEIIDESNAKIVSSALPILSVIPFQFHQLLVNILLNAIKFTKPGGTPEVTISSGVVNGDQIKHFKSAREKIYHYISIKDNGIGFDPVYGTRIFEIFQRLHNRADYEGTGVGLAICKKIVENHDGIIIAEGQPGEGATFTICLPRR